jgi:hypothetical protein
LIQSKSLIQLDESNVNCIITGLPEGIKGFDIIKNLVIIVRRVRIGKIGFYKWHIVLLIVFDCNHEHS